MAETVICGEVVLDDRGGLKHYRVLGQRLGDSP